MEKGFKLNPYKICVANKLANVKQCTILCFVDNNKVSHMEAEVVEYLMRYLTKNFGELLITRVKKHAFWGMNLNITEYKKIEIEMKYQLLEEIETFGENIDEKVTTPQSSHLFIFNKQSQKIDEEKREIFHLVVPNILYITRRARSDL